MLALCVDSVSTGAKQKERCSLRNLACLALLFAEYEVIVGIVVVIQMMGSRIDDTGIGKRAIQKR